MVAQCNRLVLLSASAADRTKVAVVKTLPMVRGAVVRIIKPRDVSARDDSEERRQRAPLFQCRGKQAGKWWTRAATARSVFGRDQLLAGDRVAALDRSVGRGNASGANARVVSRGSLRSGGSGRVDRAPEAGAVATRAAAAVGCVLAGVAAVAAA